MTFFLYKKGMLYFALYGFLIGLVIPVISGRFGKVLPADPGEILLHLCHSPHFPRVPYVGQMRCLHQKWMKLIFISFLWALFLSILFVASFLFLPENIIPWSCVLMTFIAFCITVDDLYYLLPDFFTLPMLVVGFAFAVQTQSLSPLDSILGTVFGYIIATLAVFLMGLIRKAEFGFGDVKMMMALGAWLGVQGLNFSLLLSFFLFAIPAVIGSRRRGAYGPALGIAAIISFFFIYCQ